MVSDQFRVNSYYDPKSRSMRMDPLPNVPVDDKPFAGDNFVRSGGTASGKRCAHVFF
jgi:hypothetical protein